MWAVREVERLDINLNWLVQFKLQASMSVINWADAESTNGVRGLSRSAGAPSEIWLQEEVGTPLERL